MIRFSVPQPHESSIDQVTGSECARVAHGHRRVAPAPVTGFGECTSDRPVQFAWLGRMVGLLAVTTACSAMVPDAHAQVAIGAPAIQCEYCSPTQMRQAAASQGSGEYYVADLPGGNLRRYEVWCGSGQTQAAGGAGGDAVAGPAEKDPKAPPPGGEDQVSGCTAAGHVTVLDVDPTALDQFNVVRQIWLDTSGTFRKAIDFPYVNTGLFWTPPPGPLGGPNAYNVLSDANFRGMLGTALGDSRAAYSPNVGLLGAYVAHMINAFAGQTDGLRIELRVVFPDGSSVVYLYVYDNASASYVPGSARTPVGQVIPDPESANSPVSTGYWSEFGPYGGQEDLQRFLDYMASRGVQITGGGDDGRIRGVSCSWDGETLTCVAT